MKQQDLNQQITEMMTDGVKDPDMLGLVSKTTSAFEISIIHQLMQPGGAVELDNLGVFLNQDGDILFKPSAFLQSAAQACRK